MKTILSRYLSLFILFYLLLSTRGSAFSPSTIQDESECIFNKKTARLIGEIYMLSDPMNDPNELVCFIKDHQDYFMEEGILVKSTLQLGTWMLDQKKSSLDMESILQVKNKLVDCQISEAYAFELLVRFRKSNVNFIDLGRELIWLSEVLPCLARGDLKTYLCTGTEFRNNFGNILSWYKNIHNSDPEVAEIITNRKPCSRPVTADQISLLAIISKL
jgi:hypothetical protein